MTMIQSHDWLRTVRVAYVPGELTPVLEDLAASALEQFRALGHHVQAVPDGQTDLLLTTARFGRPQGWRQSLLLTARRRFGLERSPTVYTLLHTTPAELQERLDYFASILAKQPPDPKDFEFPGLAPNAYHTLLEQGRRGGPIMALIRVLQAQLICLRIVLVVGDGRPESAYYFDLVGAHPRIMADDRAAFYEDMVLRLVTSVSTHEVTEHEIALPPLTNGAWRRLRTPAEMVQAARNLGKRHFFTEMVRVANLASVPNLHDAISSQYSEGCFATWDAEAQALMATITGSARPVEKDNISEDDLALIVGVRPDGLGAVVRHAEGKRNDSPSSESVEMREMDDRLPRMSLGADWGAWAGRPAPVSRSKLHGHRGIAAYDASQVEFVPLDPPYYHYPVSCATGAQAQAIMTAFSRSEALRNPADPRQVVFTILPGHGVVIVEKWVPGKAPFEIICDFMDAGYIEVSNDIPQGLMDYQADPVSGRYLLTEPAAEGVHA
jgi:hypothetical protein